ncbi:FAD-dependent monooxygenase [Dongia sedimenti]|uniref:FAD-dependent monooxygenase n=1 Tax=Dongia sedimenti TaxID=3064282 RepID=A0ABU0YQE3_9PROT|nr:FAD-dependent monooxygenase [Rhodospirillaceae bacterium R-7]
MRQCIDDDHVLSRGDNATSVLVVGGGLAGLSAAMFLAWQGVPTVLVERRMESSPHPRAIGFTPRTMELFRAVGLGTRIPQVPAGFRLRRARVESLAGEWFEEAPSWNPAEAESPKPECSPCTGGALAQDRLEPILQERAMACGADIRRGTELVSFIQDETGVTACLRAQDGREYTLHAAYMIAADGHRSPIRESLRIARKGRGHLRTMRSVLFRAPLDAYLEKGVMQFEIDQPDLKAFLTTYADGRWVLMFSDDVVRDEAMLRTLIAQAIGRSDLDIEIITAGRWELSALIADRFASGRIFLAGDAAHTLPPSRGGYGANTGIQDTHNLAWKLAAVLSGQSASRLLDSYDAERRPTAWLRHDQIFARPDYKAQAGPTAAETPIIDDDAMEFGQLYRSNAVIGADATLPPALRPEAWAGQPGTRAPHLWVTIAGKPVSTLDLLRSRWTLLAADDRWRAAASAAGEALGIAVACVQLGVEPLPGDAVAVLVAFGLGRTGAALIRPDGVIAWRSTDSEAHPSEALIRALGIVSAATRSKAAA